MDPGLHKHYTGVDNTVILENLRSLCRGSKPFVVRIPLIPGVNDTRENLEATAAFPGRFRFPAAGGNPALPQNRRRQVQYAGYGIPSGL